MSTDLLRKSPKRNFQILHYAWGKLTLNHPEIISFKRLWGLRSWLSRRHAHSASKDLNLFLRNHINIWYCMHMYACVFIHTHLTAHMQKIICIHTYHTQMYFSHMRAFVCEGDLWCEIVNDNFCLKLYQENQFPLKAHNTRCISLPHWEVWCIEQLHPYKSQPISQVCC